MSSNQGATRREVLKALAMGAGVAVIAPHALPNVLQKIGTARLPLKARVIAPVSLELLGDMGFPAEQFMRQMIERQTQHFSQQEGRTFKVVDVQRIDQRWVEFASYEDEFGVAQPSYPGQGVFFGELLEVV